MAPTTRISPRGLPLTRKLLVCAVVSFAAGTLSAEEIPWPKQGVEVERPRIWYLDASTFASSRLGIIRKIVREGTEVKVGDELLVLDDRVADAQFKTAAAEAENKVEIHFAVASSALARAEYELNLQANLRVPGAVPLIEVERLKLAYERSLWQIKQALHQNRINGLKSDEASEMRNTYRVHAEFPGVVTKVHKFIGEGIREGDPIIEISNPAKVKIEGFIHPEELHRVKKGARVKVKLDIPEFDIPQEDLVFDGELKFVDNAVDFVQHHVRVWAEVDNPDLVLRAGFLTKMMIETDVPPPVRKESRPKSAWLDREHVPVLR